MNGSIVSYTGSGYTNNPYTLKQYMQSEAAQENLFKLLKEASISKANLAKCDEAVHEHSKNSKEMNNKS